MLSIALLLDTPTMLVAAVVGVVVLGVAWFGVRFWLASTRPANIREINTPGLDRMNEAALDALGSAEEQGEEDEEENLEAPDELKKIVPEEDKT